MRALVLVEYNMFEIQEVSKPQLGYLDVLIRVRACGICGSDVHGMDGSTGRRIPPIIMGHEASGVIEEIGDAVTKWEKGDRVTFDSTIYCGTCWFCRRGNINLCENRKVLGVSCEDYRKDGAFAELVSVPEHVIYKLPDNISFEEASMVETLSIALHGVRRGGSDINETAVVVGTGMVGLLIVQVLKGQGCRSVIAVDINENNLKRARDLGADICLNPEKQDVETEVKKVSSGRGADKVFEVVGINETVITAIKTIRKEGRVILIGNLSSEIKIPLQKVVTGEISLLGSCASNGEYDLCLDMMSKGVVDVKPLISATPPLVDSGEWFTRLQKGNEDLLKVVIVPE